MRAVLVFPDQWQAGLADGSVLQLIADKEPHRYVFPSDPDDIHDMYVKRDAAGYILTFITCDPPAYRTARSSQGDRLIEDDSPLVPQCSHYFALPQCGVSLDVDYPRVLLRDWGASPKPRDGLRLYFSDGIFIPPGSNKKPRRRGGRRGGGGNGIWGGIRVP